MEHRAGFWIRFIALIIDGIIVGIAEFLLTSVFGGALDPETNLLVSSMFSFLLTIVYFVFYQTKNNGQTLGKKLLGIRVLTIDGRPVTIGAMFLREIIGKFVSALILLIGYLIAAGKSKRALHDYIAKTVVVRVE